MVGWTRAWALAAVFLVSAGALPVHEPQEVHVLVDASGTGQSFPRLLLGLNQHAWTPGVRDALAAAQPPESRVPAYFERAAPEPGRFDWSEMDFRLGQIAATGARPVVALGFLPAWLSSCPTAEGLEARYCPPNDLDAWAAVARAGVERAATVWGVTHFEVWNEPDHPGFWRGTLADYVDLYQVTARVVQAVAADLALDLRVGGPGTVTANPAFIPPFLAAAAERHLPVDFVSFHHYADYPFFGEVGPLPGTGLAENPTHRTETFGTGAALVRAWADAAGYRDAEVWLTEWNANAGDSERMKGDFGAAFVISAVADFLDAPLDRAHHFSTERDPWGLFSEAGAARPAWYAMRGLLGLGDQLLPVEMDDTRVAAVAARQPGGAIQIIIAHFDAQADWAGVPAQVAVTLDIAGHPGPYVVNDLQGQHLASGSLDSDGSLHLLLDNLDARLVQVGPPARP